MNDRWNRELRSEFLWFFSKSSNNQQQQQPRISKAWESIKKKLTHIKCLFLVLEENNHSTIFFNMYFDFEQIFINHSNLWAIWFGNGISSSFKMKSHKRSNAINRERERETGCVKLIINKFCIMTREKYYTLPIESQCNKLNSLLVSPFFWKVNLIIHRYFEIQLIR